MLVTRFDRAFRRCRARDSHVSHSHRDYTVEAGSAAIELDV